MHFVSQVSSADSDKDSCVKSKPPKTSKSVGTGSTCLGKREKPTSEKPPLAKKPRSNFKVGDCVKLHDGKLGKSFCVVQVFGDRCLLFCRKGVLTTGCAKRQLTTVSGDVSISVDNWRTAAKTSLQDVASDSESLKLCNCGLTTLAVEHVVDLTEDTSHVFSQELCNCKQHLSVHSPIFLAHRQKTGSPIA